MRMASAFKTCVLRDTQLEKYHHQSTQYNVCIFLYFANDQSLC